MIAAFHGLLVLDKPSGITSRDAVNRAQRWFPRGTRLGHTGTLDPLATGILVLCVGEATRLAEYVQRMTKTYRTRLLLGARSDTDDADGMIRPVDGATPPEVGRVAHVLGGFVGDIEQVPPAYSAAKVTGRRAYKLARCGQALSLAARRVSVHAIDLLSYVYPALELEVRCGKGTYIRSLARDLGERLGCGALVETLRRTRVGPFDVADALGLERDVATARRRLLPVAAALSDLPRVTVTRAQAGFLRHGQGITLDQASLPTQLPTGPVEVAVYCDHGTLAAVGLLVPESGLLRPEKVLAAP
jgi:tRNA pseudouridine55 synthase